jgi:hypothetical protein
MLKPRTVLVLEAESTQKRFKSLISHLCQKRICWTQWDSEDWDSVLELSKDRESRQESSEDP